MEKPSKTESDEAFTIFQRRLKLMIKEKGLTNIQFAQLANISINTFNMYVGRGSWPSALTALRMAQALDTTVEFLLTGKPPLSKSMDMFYTWTQHELAEQVREFMVSTVSAKMRALQ